jgi:hypothetical protein
MTLPAVLFGVVLSSLFGALFHLWRGGSLGRLLLYIVLSWGGFWGGHALATQMGWSFGSVGSLRVGMGTLGSLLCLGVGYWLSLIQVEKPS